MKNQKHPLDDKAATEQPVAEEVIVEEVKNAAGKTVAEGVAVEEVVEEKAPADASATDKVAKTAKAVERTAALKTKKQYLLKQKNKSF